MANKSELIALYTEAKAAYYDGEPIMNDAEFDELESKLKALGTDVQTVGAPERAGKVKLPVQMGSLDQLYNEEELARWLGKIPKNTRLICTEKLDGNSGLLEYTNGVLTASFSRGDGVEGANNLRHTIRIPSVPKTVNKTIQYVRGELIVSKDAWNDHVSKATRNRAGKLYANARNFVAGFLNGKEGEASMYPHITFVAYEIVGSKLSKHDQLSALHFNGFVTPAYVTLVADEASYSEMEDVVRNLVKFSDYELDGIVVDVDEPATRDALPWSDLNPGYARKLKLINDAATATTVVTGIEWNPSKDGLLKPLVYFEPVQLCGVTISKASGHNALNIKTRGIAVGSRVVIVRSGDVIPYIRDCLDPQPFVMPQCSKWDDTETNLLIVGGEFDATVKCRQLEHFFGVLEVEHIGAGNIARLYESAGITTPIDAILANDSVYEAVLGVVGARARASLREKLSAVEPHVLFAAFDVLGRGIGRRTLKRLFETYPWEGVLAGKYSVADIAKVDDIGEKTATKIVEGLPELRAMYETIAHSVQFVKPKEVAASGKFAGEVFCPTGVRFTPEHVQAVENEGGVVTDTMGKSVTVLVAKDPNSNSSKIGKAKASGIRVISLAEFVDML